MFTQGARTASPLTAEELPSWTFCPGRTEAGFSARRMGTTGVDGRFKDVHGKFYLDPERPLASTCFGEIDATKLYPGEPRLNTQSYASLTSWAWETARSHSRRSWSTVP